MMLHFTSGKDAFKNAVVPGSVWLVPGRRGTTECVEMLAWGEDRENGIVLC